MNTEKLTITSVKDCDGEYDIDKRLPITLEQWLEILKDIAENDTDMWNLLREFHKAKDQSAYIRDVAKARKCSRRDIELAVESLAKRIGEGIGTFRIVRRLNPSSEFWTPVLFCIKVVEENGPENIYRLRHDLVVVMDEMTRIQRSASAKSRESKGGIGAPIMYFFDMGLDVGDELVYLPDPTITAKIVSNRKVFCLGKETYMTPLTQEICGKKDFGKLWACNGKTIHEYYMDTYYPNGKTYQDYVAEETERRRKAQEEAENK